MAMGLDKVRISHKRSEANLPELLALPKRLGELLVPPLVPPSPERARFWIAPVENNRGASARQG